MVRFNIANRAANQILKFSRASADYVASLPHGRATAFLRTFSTARGGSTAFVFALAILPISLAAGMAVDFERAQMARTNLQSSLDAVALMTLRDASNLSEGQINQRAEEFFALSLGNSKTPNAELTAHYDNATSTIELSAKAKIPTSFLQLAGYSELPVSVTTQAISGIGKLELAMVLDNTGSMSSSGKIQALIATSHQLLSTLQAAAGSAGSVKVSIVPFDTHVNIGLGNLTEPWMDWSFYTSGDTYGQGFDSQQSSGNSCTNGQANGDSDNNGKGKCKTVVAQAFNASWTGCVIDRDQPYDIVNTPPTSDPATFYPATDCNLAPLLPLTTDWAALNHEVDLMQAAGSTDLPIGLVWGWNMLTPGAPDSAAPLASAETRRVIVFLTDGVNTQNAWTHNSTDIDAETTAVCDNIKADGVTIFTIRVVDGNAALLQSCASNPSMYYNVTDSTQLAAAFQAFTHSLIQPPHLTR